MLVCVCVNTDNLDLVEWVFPQAETTDLFIFFYLCQKAFVGGVGERGPSGRGCMYTYDWLASLYSKGN